MNFLSSSVNSGKAMLGTIEISVPTSIATVTIGIRPEEFIPIATGFEVLVEAVEELAADLFVYGKPIDKSLKFSNASEELNKIVIRWDPKSPPKVGQTVTVGVNLDAINLFDPTTGERIN
jgi:multiple sugar transport system ATP-binding protein